MYSADKDIKNMFKEEVLLLAAFLEDEEREILRKEMELKKKRLQELAKLRVAKEKENEKNTSIFDRGLIAGTSLNTMQGIQSTEKTHLNIYSRKRKKKIKDVESHVQKKRNLKKRKWVCEANLHREEMGEFCSLYPQLRENEEQFFVYFRITPQTFDELLALIKFDIKKGNTIFRRCIEPTERLAVALRFLATGDSLMKIGRRYRMGFSTVGAIIREVCEAIWRRLQPIYMPEVTEEMWENNIIGFSEKWRIPNCIGCLDFKDIPVRCLKPESNYSAVLLAIVDHESKFMSIDVGGFDRNSRSNMFETSATGQRLSNGTMNVPSSRPLPGESEPSPCVLLGDKSSPLLPYIMRPFPERSIKYDTKKVEFNKRLREGREVVENAFNMLARKWGIFCKPFDVRLDKVIKYVRAVCILHNFLLSKSYDNNFVQLLDPAVSNLREFDYSISGRRSSNQAVAVRNRFLNYFNSNDS